MKYQTYTRELLEPVVASSSSWAEVCRKLDRQPGTGGQTHISRTAKALGIDSSHFSSNVYKAENIKVQMLGKRFGKLVVLRYTGPGTRGSLWEVQCDCGNIVEVHTGTMNAGNTQSCGCSHHRKGADNKRWKGYGDISGLYWKSLQFGADRRGIAFRITIEHAWELFQKQDGKCALSGVELVMGIKSAATASLDRIDSSRGYTEGNVQWIHKDLNRMKGIHSDKELIAWAHKISDYQRSL